MLGERGEDSGARGSLLDWRGLADENEGDSLGKLLVAAGAIVCAGVGPEPRPGRACVPDSGESGLRCVVSVPGFIAGHDDKIGSGKMELKESRRHVSAKFNSRRSSRGAHTSVAGKGVLEELAGGVRGRAARS